MFNSETADVPRSCESWSDAQVRAEVERKQIERRRRDTLARRVSFSVAVGASLLVVVIALALLWRSSAVLSAVPIGRLLFGSTWRPSVTEFGLLPFIVGTACVTGLAMVLAIPVCVLSAIYLAQYASKKIRRAVVPLVDLLAGIPSVVHGLWGVLFVVPVLREYVGPWLGRSTTGYSLLAGAIVLAIMVAPIIVSVSDEVLRAVPCEVVDASLALGATRWQTVKHVVLRRALPGVIAAVILGFSRALGETMAVIMVIGNVAKVPSSVLDPAATLPGLIANNYGEIMSVPLYDSALLLAALVLFVIVMAFNVLARVVLQRAERRCA